MQVVDQSNTVVFDKEIKQELTGVTPPSKSPFRKGAYEITVKVSDLSSKTKTSLVTFLSQYLIEDNREESEEARDSGG